MKETFDRLRATMLKCARGMIVVRDEAEVLDLNAPWPNPTNRSKPMWFGGVRIGKRFVSVHLMPVYLDAELKSSIPPDLARRMQDKTCFNFTRIEDGQLRQLAELIARASARFAAEPPAAKRTTE